MCYTKSHTVTLAVEEGERGRWDGGVRGEEAGDHGSMSVKYYRICLMKVGTVQPACLFLAAVWADAVSRRGREGEIHAKWPCGFVVEGDGEDIHMRQHAIGKIPADGTVALQRRVYTRRVTAQPRCGFARRCGYDI